MRFFAIAVVGLLTAAPAVAQTISLHDGETVTLRFEEGKAVVLQRGPAEPMSKYEAYVEWRAETEQVPAGAKTMPPSFVRQGEGPPDPPRPVPNQVQLTFRHIPGEPNSSGRSVLFLSNGYASKFSYRVAMHAKGRSAPTDVCEVPANFPGLEYWPFVIDELDISEIHLDPDGGPIRCE